MLGPRVPVGGLDSRPPPLMPSTRAFALQGGAKACRASSGTVTRNLSIFCQTRNAIPNSRLRFHAALAVVDVALIILLSSR
jgi:hypothetical protein